MNEHDALLAAAHQIKKKTGEMPIILNQELYEFAESTVRIVDINIYPAGARCTVELPFGTLQKCELEDLCLRPMRKPSSPYEKHVEYRFEIRGNEFAAMRIGKDSGGCPCVDIEETGKNGQEECHQADTAYFQDGNWHFECDGDSFDDYGNIGATEILEFLTKNTPPGIEI